MFDAYKEFARKGLDQPRGNNFWPVSEWEISVAERQLERQFPDNLRRFYLEVGYGFFINGLNNSTASRFLVNRVMDPRSIARVLLTPESPERPEEGFPSGVLPFFDLGSRVVSGAPQSRKQPPSADGIMRSWHRIAELLHSTKGILI